jgi:phospholipase/carboxylesterase
VESLVYRERPAAGDPDGLLVLHHGRGTSEEDLLGLADALDPGRRLLVVTPRAPLQVVGLPGYHWYLVPRFGYPDPDTFHAARGALAEFHDRLWEETAIPPTRTVLGGFSMGTVMSYTTALDVGRPPVSGILAFSGFVPEVEGWQPHFEDRRDTRTFVAHGRSDPIIGVDYAHRARGQLEAGGLGVEYHESDVDHRIDPAHLRAASEWLDATLPASGPGP